ncbi:MAG: DNA adenine methylase, partial [Planctomycetota bacterium]
GVSGLADGLGLPASDLQGAFERSVADKTRRLLRLEAKHGNTFGPQDLPDHFETALQAGYYTAVRDAWTPEDRPGQVARFFFLRAMCYGSMFRYGKDGRFNIPYGGISYNRVDFGAKADRLFEADVRDLLGRADLACLDFEAHLDSVRDRLTDGAFVFLDPPYDTEFSDYAKLAFGRAEQERLARVFAELPCPALMVIQGTEFIRGLYEEVGRAKAGHGEPFFLTDYAKTYGYNVRGRNERKTTHLLIGNYEPA